MSLYTGIYALSCGLNANYSFFLFLIRQLEQLSFELTFDPDLQVWWPYPNDPFVCKHGKAAVVEGQGHGQKLGHFCGDIWCLWNTFERNYITHQFHGLKVIVFSSISQHFIFCNFSFSFTKTDLINIVQQTIYDDTIFSGEKTLKCFATLYNLILYIHWNTRPHHHQHFFQIGGLIYYLIYRYLNSHAYTYLKRIVSWGTTGTNIGWGWGLIMIYNSFFWGLGNI